MTYQNGYIIVLGNRIEPFKMGTLPICGLINSINRVLADDSKNHQYPPGTVIIVWSNGMPQCAAVVPGEEES